MLLTFLRLWSNSFEVFGSSFVTALSKLASIISENEILEYFSVKLKSILTTYLLILALSLHP